MRQIILLFLIGYIVCISAAYCEDENTPNLQPTVQESSADFQISLAQWSLQTSFLGEPVTDWGRFDRLLKAHPDSLLMGKADPIDFPKIAAGYGIYSIELVNYFYYNLAEDKDYWSVFKKKCDETGVSVGIIMCDRIGDLGHVDSVARITAVENHYKWVDVAKFLGAHSVRVNAAGEGSAEELARNVIHSLSILGEYAALKGINILVENHGGYSSDGSWLATVIKNIGMDNVGTLPDFDNFCIEGYNPYCENEYDKYKGIAELMPYAKGVSAKSYNFDKEGNETRSDFLRLMKIVKESGYKGYIGIEYEGLVLSEEEGIIATKRLLEKVFNEL